MSSSGQHKKQKFDIPDPQSIPLPEDINSPSETPSSNNSADRTSSTSSKRTKSNTPQPVIAVSSREEEELMRKMLGFSSFDSTKGKQVPGNNVGAVHVVKKRRYRQYMNRKGGFNRPLDKVA